MSSGPPPLAVLVVALVVLIGGIAAAVVDDDHAPVTSPSRSSSSAAASPSSSGGVTTPASRAASSSVTTPTSPGATTVRPAVASPEAAANGLWAAYAASNRIAAQRFATDDVIRVLFEEPYNGEQGMFQSCRPQTDGFECRYVQASVDYSMIAKPDGAGSFKIVDITVSTA